MNNEHYIGGEPNPYVYVGNYGDVNYMEYGGQFIWRNDGRKCWRGVVAEPLDSGGWNIWEFELDYSDMLVDGWIDRAAIASYCGSNNDIDIVVGAISYYGENELTGGYVNGTIYNHDDAIELLRVKGVK